mmetsp:Transcript_24738/g.62201  ORF Transcript_24738/g.62201 Transcript_24738/m.62201 type:complete len:495 (-) Transcript_24738:1394-2878(-)
MWEEERQRSLGRTKSAAEGPVEASCSVTAAESFCTSFPEELLRFLRGSLASLLLILDLLDSATSRSEERADSSPRATMVSALRAESSFGSATSSPLSDEKLSPDGFAPRVVPLLFSSSWSVTASAMTLVPTRLCSTCSAASAPGPSRSAFSRRSRKSSNSLPRSPSADSACSFCRPGAACRFLETRFAKYIGEGSGFVFFLLDPSGSPSAASPASSSSSSSLSVEKSASSLRTPPSLSSKPSAFTQADRAAKPRCVRFLFSSDSHGLYGFRFKNPTHITGPSFASSAVTGGFPNLATSARRDFLAAFFSSVPSFAMVSVDGGAFSGSSPVMALASIPTPSVSEDRKPPPAPSLLLSWSSFSFPSASAATALGIDFFPRPLAASSDFFFSTSAFPTSVSRLFPSSPPPTRLSTSAVTAFAALVKPSPTPDAKLPRPPKKPPPPSSVAAWRPSIILRRISGFRLTGPEEEELEGVGRVVNVDGWTNNGLIPMVRLT